MSAGFGTGERFRSGAEQTPGPGAYDPKRDLGFRADPTSGFQGNERFGSDGSKIDGSLTSSNPSPRQPKPPKDSRQYSWATKRIAELEQEVDRLKIRVKEKDRMLEEQSALLARKAQSEEALQMTQAQLKHSKGNSDTEIEQLKSQLLIAKERRSKLEKELREVEGRCTARGREVSVLESQMVLFQKEMSNQTTRMKSVSSEIDSLQRQLKESKETGAAHEAEIERLRLDLVAAQNSLVGKEMEFENDVADMMKKMEESKAAHEEDVNSLNKQIDAARQEVSFRGSTIEELEGKLEKSKSRLSTSREEITALRQKCKDLEADNSGRSSELDAATAKLKEVEDRLSTRDNQLEAAQMDVNDLQKEKEAVQAAAEESAMVASEKIADLELGLTSKSQEIANLEKANSELKSLSENKDNTISGLEAELEAKSAEVEARSKENDSLLEELKKRISDLESQLSDKTEENGKLEALLEIARGELEALKQNLSASEERLDASVAELEKTKAMASVLEVKLQEARQELENKAKKFEDDKVQMTLRISDAANRITAMQEAVEAKAAACSQMSSTIENLKKESAEKLSSAVAESEAKEKKLEEMVAAMAELQSKVDAQQEQIAAVTKEKDDLAEDSNNRVQEHTQKVGEFEGMLLQLNLNITALEEKNQALEQDGKDKEAMAESLQTEIEKVREEARIRLAKVEEDFAATTKLVEEKTAALAKLESEFAESTRRAEEKEAALAKLEADFAASSKLAQEKEQALATLEASAANTAKTADEKQEAIAKLQAELAAASKLVNENEAAMQKMASELENATRTAEEKEAALSKLENDLVGVSASTSEHRAAMAALEAELANASKIAEEKSAALARSEAELASLSKLVGEKDNVLPKLEAELAAARGAVAEKAQQLAKVEESNMELKRKSQKSEVDLLDKMDRMKKKHEMQIQAFKSETGAVTALKEELTALEKSIEKSRGREEELEGQLSSANRRIEELEACNPGNDDQLVTLQITLEEVQKESAKARALAMRYKAELKRDETMKLEMDRLQEENTLLIRRTAQLDADVSGFLTSNNSVLGHHNPKQKIQYHLKLKQELEELRKECTNLLREKFHLEQCIRYLSSVGIVEGLDYSLPDTRSNQVLIPKSLAGNVLTSTPTSRNHMKWSGRGQAARDEELSPYQSRENMEMAIHEIQLQTAEAAQGFTKGAEDPEFDAESPTASMKSPPDTPHLSPTRSVDSQQSYPVPDPMELKIHSRIVARIHAIVERKPKKRHANGEKAALS